MWIRSQDKIWLIKANNFQIVDYDINKYDIYVNHDYCVGTYSTKEKALRISEMIEQWIDGIEYSKTTKSYRASYVFQMPQDDKVLVND